MSLTILFSRIPNKTTESGTDEITISGSGDALPYTGVETDEITISGSGDGRLTLGDDTDEIAISGSGDGLPYTVIETDEITLSGSGASEIEATLAGTDVITPSGSGDGSPLAGIDTDEITISGSGDNQIEVTLTGTDEIALSGSGDGLDYTDFLTQYLGSAYERFKFTLDGTEIPISTFQARFKSGDPTHLQVTIPDYVTWAATVAAATDGEMIIAGTYFYGGETVLTQQILAVDVDSIDFSEGPSSKTITLKGKRTISTTAQVAALSGSYSKQTQSGTTTYQLAVIDYFLRPGDTATIGDDTITVDSITYTVSPGQAQMTVKAA